MKPIRHVQQWSRDSCLSACLLMMTDHEIIPELRESMDALYKRSGNIHACASLLSIKCRTVNWPAGQWVKGGGIFLVFVVKESEFHALIVDVRSGEPVVYDPARGWGDGEYVWSDPEAGTKDRSLQHSLYLPAVEFTDRIWFGH